MFSLTIIKSAFAGDARHCVEWGWWGAGRWWGVGCRPSGQLGWLPVEIFRLMGLTKVASSYLHRMT